MRGDIADTLSRSRDLNRTGGAGGGIGVPPMPGRADRRFGLSDLGKVVLCLSRQVVDIGIAFGPLGGALLRREPEIAAGAQLLHLPQCRVLAAMGVAGQLVEIGRGLRAMARDMLEPADLARGGPHLRLWRDVVEGGSAEAIQLRHAGSLARVTAPAKALSGHLADFLRVSPDLRSPPVRYGPPGSAMARRSGFGCRRGSRRSLPVRRGAGSPG